jgi:hypothetical protein
MYLVEAEQSSEGLKNDGNMAVTPVKTVSSRYGFCSSPSPAFPDV